MVAFYNQGDQNIYKDFQYVPQEKYRLGFTAPTAAPIAAPVSSGITNTNAFTNSGGNNSYSGPTSNLINNFNAINQDKYFNSLPTPNVDGLDQSMRDKTFMGMRSYNENQDVNPVDAGEYLAAGQDIPTNFSPTYAGRVQETLGKGKDLIGKGVGMAANAAIGIPGLSYALGKLDRFSSLPQLDQQYINQSKYYTGPTVFGDNNSGLGKDPFGINTRSAFGNYAQYVRDLVKSGKLKGDRKTFYEKEMEKQEQNKKIAIANEKNAGAAANAGTQRGGGAGDSSTSHMGGISQSQADAVGKANKDAGMGGWGLKDGGRAGYFFGGRVNFKNGGLASIL
jgi:hypothetical protein